jgi:hypothetical protein
MRQRHRHAEFMMSITAQIPVFSSRMPGKSMHGFPAAKKPRACSAVSFSSRSRRSKNAGTSSRRPGLSHAEVSTGGRHGDVDRDAK